MALLYNKVQRRNPQDLEAPAKWYPVLKTARMKRESEVAKEIADETTLNPKEAEMAIAQLKKIMIRTLLNGESVQLGDWGSFYLSLNTEGSATEEEATAAKVKKINIRFLPGVELKEAIAKAEFIDAATLSNKPKTPAV